MFWRIAWSLAGLAALICFWGSVWFWREGGSWFAQGWLNHTKMTQVDCPVCNGHGWLVLREVHPGVMAYTKLPSYDEGDRYHEPDDANAVECDACGGMGELLKESGRGELFIRLPLALFRWRW